MTKHHSSTPHSGPGADVGRGVRRAAIASLLVVAGLTLFAFVALHRAPLPAEAFTALAVQLTDSTDMARTA